jgi:hypothetical protein
VTIHNQEDHVSETADAAAPPADPFASGAGGDPFATAPANGETPVTPEAPAADAPAADIPVVNREGEQIEPPAAEATEPETPAEPTPEPPAAPEEAPAAPEQPEAPAEPQEAPQPPVEPQEQETPAPAAQPAATASSDGAQAAAADTGGKSPIRHYKLLYQTADKQWTEADLSGIGDDLKPHTETIEGEVFLRARNADHARRLAWIIFGRPQNGVTVNPVAKSSWKPKRLSPAPSAPERERLSIT